MEYLGGESCRFCLSSVSDKSFKVIEEAVSSSNGILDVLKLDFNDGQKHVMCNICCDKLHAAREFKSTCLSTEAAIISYIDVEKPVSIDLREIFLKKEGVGISDGQEICRLCMQLVKDEWTSVYELKMDIFQKYIPEMNFSITKGPVICKLCLGKLLNHTSFLKNCFAVHTKIEKSFDENITNPNLVASHSELWIKSEMNEQNEKEPIKVENEKSETNFEGTEVKWEVEKALIKTEEIEIKDEFVDEPSLPSTHYPLELNEGVPMDKKPKEVIDDVEHSLNVDIELCSKRKIHKWYKCSVCDYTSKWKKLVQRHMLTHKDSSEIQWFVCDTCGYKAKRKCHLNQHLLKHKKSSEIQWHKCDVCGQYYKRKSHLNRHMLIHKDSSEIQWYECKMCLYKAKEKSHLKRHMLIHKGSS